MTIAAGRRRRSNYAIKHFNLNFVRLADELSRADFYGSCPTEKSIHAACRGKPFFNFDDAAFGPVLLRYLSQRFPKPCNLKRFL
jgi:hypothetical protein